jgi:hypothetical protein
MENGGKRKGAGRPKGISTKILARQAHAGEILDSIGERSAWQWAYETAKKKKDVKTLVDILKYLTDRRDGKPKQQIEGTGEGGKFEVLVRNVGRVPKSESD